MLPPYTKPFLSFADQVALLKGRGLHITDDAKAEQCLARIGYYRLKDYWFPFRVAQKVAAPDGGTQEIITEQFRPGTRFDHAVDLYVFDKKLRMLMMDAIERIEVALRVDLAHVLGKRDAWAHRDPVHLDPKRAVALKDGVTRHAAWILRADDAESRSRSDWARAFRGGYGSPMPVWMAVETWEFGTLSHLLEMLHPVDRMDISRKYSIPNSNLLISWVKTLSNVRNICAHHGRLWNHPLVNQPMIPTKAEVSSMNHLGTYNATQTRVYAAAAIAQYLLGAINPTSSWKARLKTLWGAFPSIPATNAIQAGFMPAWRSWPLWQ